MAANVFISFDHDDQRQCAGFRLLKDNPNHPLDFQDHSLKEPVLCRSGQPLEHPPTDPRSRPVRDEIVGKFNRASRLVVLIGDATSKSEWVTWEINTFYALKFEVSGEKTWKRIRGMTLKGSDRAEIPTALMNGRSTAWNPDELDKWLDQEPDA